MEGDLQVISIFYPRIAVFSFFSVVFHILFCLLDYVL